MPSNPSESLFLPAKYPRMIPLPRPVRDGLQEHALRQHQEQANALTSWQPHDLVLCTQQGRTLSPSRLTPMIQDFLQEARVPLLRFHELRYTAIHLLLRSGIAPGVVGAILGIGVMGPTRPISQGSVSLQGYEEVRQAMEKLFFEL